MFQNNKFSKSNRAMWRKNHFFGLVPTFQKLNFCRLFQIVQVVPNIVLNCKIKIIVVKWKKKKNFFVLVTHFLKMKFLSVVSNCPSCSEHCSKWTIGKTQADSPMGHVGPPIYVFFSNEIWKVIFKHVNKKILW